MAGAIPNVAPAASTQVADLMAPAHLLATAVAKDSTPANLFNAPKAAATGLGSTVQSAADCAKAAAENNRNKIVAHALMRAAFTLV